MSATRAGRAGLACIVAVCGCFYSSAPRGWQSTTAHAPTDPYGGWISLRRTAGDDVEGELLAVTLDSIHVLPLAGGWVAVARSNVRQSVLAGYRVSLTPYVLWTVLGIASTASHGAFLILSAPVWAIAGVATTASASRAPRITTTLPDNLSPYARFPQGLPPGIDRDKILTKPQRR